MKKLLSLLLPLFGWHISQAQIGIYDINASFGVNWGKPKKNMMMKGWFGTDYDLGLTIVNIPYDKSGGAATTLEVHYDYSRQNFDSHVLGTWHFRRQEVYARLRPFTFNPAYSSHSDRVIGILIAGLYADVGYTKGHYYYRDYLEEKVDPTYQQNGFFWGWGYNIKFRTEERLGIIAGYGSKIYTWKYAENKSVKYSSRSFCLGVSYALVWKE